MPKQAAPKQAAPKQTAPKQTAPNYQLVLAFDHGSQRIGLAIGQLLTQSARPLCVLAAKRGVPVWPQIKQQLEQWQPDALLVGIPRHADGSASHSTQAALQFCRQLQQYQLPVLTIDERLSSQEAKSRLQSGSSRRAQVIDHYAAALILESWLQQPNLAHHV